MPTKNETRARGKNKTRNWKDHPWAKSDSVMHVRLTSKDVLVNARVLAAKSEMTLSRWVDRLLREAIDDEWAPALVHSYKPMTEDK